MTGELKSTGERKGWLLPYLAVLDEMFYGRWHYWTDAVLSDRIPNEPIPYIPFKDPQAYQEKLTQNNLLECLNYAEYNSSNALEQLVDWILWGLGEGERSLAVSDKVDDYWYRTFNLGLFYKEPADHLGLLTAESGAGKTGGYFPTPSNVTEMMVRMTFGSEPRHDHKRQSVCDPCCGTGIMLLHASNYSLNLYGNDINPLVTRIALINSYIYVPWLACRPKSLRMFDKPSGVIEVELPTGVRLPKCQCGNGHNAFLLDLKTNHSVKVAGGMLTVGQPDISIDLVAQNLRPENITCAACHHNQEEENT